MPELPEVETVRRSLVPHLTQRTITTLTIRQPRLRWLIPDSLPSQLAGVTVQTLSRRAKYLLLHTSGGVLIVHLGMSGHLRWLTSAPPPDKHEHYDLVFEHGILRYRDPRRFGALLWYAQTDSPPAVLQHLGVEPLSEALDSTYLCAAIQRRRTPIKGLIMNAKIIVGVGNIYANEALFMAKIHPQRRADTLTRTDCERLVVAIKTILNQAIELGGSSLRDFSHTDGRPGYFQQTYAVYGRTHQPCPLCTTPIQRITLGQRGTFFCPRCQT